MEIRFLPYQPHCFAFGGFDLQMLSTFDELKKLKANIEKLNVWDRESNFDILHCWGLGLPNYENIYWGKKANKKVVVTSLHGYYETNIEVVKFYMSLLFYKQRFTQEMIKNIDAIVVMNEQQADVCYRYFKIPEKKVKIIPHVVHEKFFISREEAMITINKGYILTVGNVCKRKNQVKLALSCVAANMPLVIIGKPLEGESEYAQQLEQIVLQNEGLTWIKGLRENSELLLDYYKNCLAMALPSFVEQQPISLLEAAVLNKPLIVADRAYAKQKYYSNCQVVDPNSINSIKAGIINVKNNPSKYYPDFQPLLDCRGAQVAGDYLKLYEELVA